MIGHIRKWGNSIAIRIPKAFARQLGLNINIPVLLSIENGRLIITPQRYSLEELLVQVNETNIHQEINPGNPLGREEW
jgi:antitoxin MazE